MPNTAALAAYAARRDAWLERTIAFMRADDRFVAAWLAGSFGRGAHGAVSDLDLHVVLSDDANPLLHKPVQVWANTTPERRAVFEKLGTLVLTHENHWNAICNGTFTLLIYADLVMVDWQFIAVSQAIRPHFTQLLFAKRTIPYAPAPLPEDAATRHADLVEQTGYFWLMTGTACRYIVRGDAPATVAQLSMIHGVLDGLERLLRQEPDIWGRHILPPFELPAADAPAWISRLRGYCRLMVELYPRIEAEVGHPPQPGPLAQIEALLALADNDASASRERK